MAGKLTLCSCQMAKSIYLRGCTRVAGPGPAVRTKSIFSRFRRKGDKEPPILPASEAGEGPDGERRKYLQGEDMVLKGEINALKSRSKGLTNRRAYRPPSDVEERIQRVAAPLCGEDENWSQLQLTDPELKFKVLTELMAEFDHNVPNTSLHDIQNIADVVEFFSTEVRLSSALDDMATLDLPPNLHIQTEYTRFDPNKTDDPLTRGRTAFPGSNTYVTSLKYRRKYDDIITNKPKPGFVNHYEGY